MASVTKKSLQASERGRPDIWQERELWIERRKRFFAEALARLVFIDVEAEKQSTTQSIAR